VSRSLFVRNRQRTRRVDSSQLRAVATTLLRLLRFQQYDIGVYLVADPEMTQLNETFLGHAGSTDVITFNYAEPGAPITIHGEIFICVEEAVRQARKFRVPWQTELTRYLVHAVLHLKGYDDREPKQRRPMKRIEGALLRALGRLHRLASLHARK
jgi:probable rRNA maturation factor